MSASAIHPSASIAPSAKLAPGVKVGAFAVVGDGVELGEDCVLHAHAVVSGPSRFGGANMFYPFCVIGGDPQDYTFAGEVTELVAGNKNIFREYVTVSRGTKKGGGVTRISDENFFLNAATVAGHVTVEDFTTVGALSSVHQFCRIGRYAYVGASTVITQDV